MIQSKSKTAGIYLRIGEGRLFDVKAKTNFIIDSANWSNSKGKPIALKTEATKKLDSDLADLRNDLLAHYNATDNKLDITTQWLKDFINPPKKVAKASNKLIEFIDYYNAQQTDKVEASTLRRSKATRNLIKKFETSCSSVFLIKHVDIDFALRFEQYCFGEKYSQNTTARATKFLKTICYYAKTKDIETSSKLDLIKPPKVDGIAKIYLTLDELAKIEKKKYETESLNNAKDWLLISCETGQRVSDFMRFDKDQIRIENGKTLIEFTQVKTGKIMSVPLSKRVTDILKTRKGDFPKRISDQKYNDYIKDVCKIAEINDKVKGSIVEVTKKVKRKKSGTFEKWELVSSHIGRRSFATNKYGIVPTSLLIGATGHSTEAMFLEYIGKTDTQKALQLADYI